MNKAFTKESSSDFDLQDESLDHYLPPPGGKNFLTPGGFRRLSAELTQLTSTVRPQLLAEAAHGDSLSALERSVLQQKLRECQRRLLYLQNCLAIAEVVEPGGETPNEVRFGATVTVGEDNSTKQYTIVGMEEADADKGRISWASPLAGVLLKTQVGDVVTFSSPKGERELEIIGLRYEPLE